MHHTHDNEIILLYDPANSKPKELTAAWITTRADIYEPFIAHMNLTVADYCSQYIRAHASEIEDVGINALTEVLLKPAGIHLEIIYLDRSAGSEANVHHYGPISYAATSRLLYRPYAVHPFVDWVLAKNYSGHYDILYKPEDAISMPTEGPIARGLPTYNLASMDPYFVEHDTSNFVASVPETFLANPIHDWTTGSPNLDTSFDAFMMPALGFDASQIYPIYPYLDNFQHVEHQPHPAYGVLGPLTQHALPLRTASQQPQQPQSPHRIIGPPRQSVSPTSATVQDRDMFRPSIHMYEHMALHPQNTHNDAFRSAQYRQYDTPRYKHST